MPDEIPDKWRGFLAEIDDSLEEETALHCIGGFVIRARYNFARETSDLDFICCLPKENQPKLLITGSASSKKKIDAKLPKNKSKKIRFVGVKSNHLFSRQNFQSSPRC